MRYAQGDALFVDQLGIEGTPSKPSFAEDGDSGSAVVNDRDEIVGVVMGYSDVSNLVFANRIEPVLSHFGVAVVTT